MQKDTPGVYRLKRSRLEQIVREELAAHIRELREAPEPPEDEDEPKEPTGQEPEAPKKSVGGPAKPKARTPAPTKSTADAPEKDAQKSAAADPDKPGAPEDPADADLDADEPEDSDDGTGEDDADPLAGKLSEELEGRRVQSLTVEPKSQKVPGASEIVVTFSDVPDPLRIIVTKTGEYRFSYKGALYNIP